MSRLGKILYLISGLSIVGFLVTRFILGGFVPLLWLPLGLFLASIIGAIIVDRKLYIDFFTMKTTKHGMNMGVMILFVLVMLIAINFVSIRHYKTFDFSLSQQNSLSDQSVKLLKSLDGDLKITFFYKEGMEEAQQNRKAFQTLVKRYQDVSSKVSLDFVDVNKRPDLAEQYGVNKGGGIVFVEYKGKRNRIEKIDEQEITGAIIKATREKDKMVYLITGHGEGSLEDTQEPSGFAQLKVFLEGNRYQLKPLSLVTSGQVPSDADALLIVGAKQFFTEAEITILDKYMQNGGNLFLALDPFVHHGLNAFLDKVGVKLSNNFIIPVIQTLQGMEPYPSATPALDFSPTHSITKVFSKNEFVLFQLPQGIQKGTLPPKMTYEEIVKTGENIYGYPNTKFEGEGAKGPFALAVALKGPWPGGTKDSQLVVVGDSDFLNNQMLYRNLNRDLFLNSILTLAKEENMVSITPKEITATQLTLTENQFYIFIFAFIIPLPLLMLVSSGFLWYRRRNA